MSWFKKGDIVRVNGKPAIVDSEVYTKFVSEDYNHEIVRDGDEGGFAVEHVNVIFPDTGIKWTVKTVHITTLGREFP